jgi:hypothetical protein
MVWSASLVNNLDRNWCSGVCEDNKASQTRLALPINHTLSTKNHLFQFKESKHLSPKKPVHLM